MKGALQGRGSVSAHQGYCINRSQMGPMRRGVREFGRHVECRLRISWVEVDEMPQIVVDEYSVVFCKT